MGLNFLERMENKSSKGKKGKVGKGVAVTTTCASQTETLGEQLAKSLFPGAVLAFTGGLGAGKTTFTRGLARGLGVTGRVTSPTYTIVNEYDQIPIPFIHFDMYRIGSSQELFELGWDDYLEQGAIIAVEWAENIKDFLPADTIWVDIQTLDEQRREITITKGKIPWEF